MNQSDLQTVDGRLIVDHWTEPFDGKNISDLLKHYAVVSHQLSGDAWMEGRVTIQEGFFQQTFDYEKYAPATKHTFHIGKRDSKRVAIVLDTKGKIYYDKDNIQGDNIITILSENVSEEYLEHLRSMGISYLFSGPDGKDIETAMKILNALIGQYKHVIAYQAETRSNDAMIDSEVDRLRLQAAEAEVKKQRLEVKAARAAEKAAEKLRLADEKSKKRKCKRFP